MTDKAIILIDGGYFDNISRHAPSIGARDCYFYIDTVCLCDFVEDVL